MNNASTKNKLKNKENSFQMVYGMNIKLEALICP